LRLAAAASRFLSYFVQFSRCGSRKSSNSPSCVTSVRRNLEFGENKNKNVLIKFGRDHVARGG